MTATPSTVSPASWMAAFSPADDQRWLEVLEAMYDARAEWLIDHRAETNAPVAIRALRAIDELLEGSPDHARRAIVKFRLASNARRRAADGTWEPGNSLYMTVNCWGRLAKGVVGSLSKGDAVVVGQGLLTVRAPAQPAT